MAVRAALLGWIAGLAVTSPVQAGIVLLNSGSSLQLMASALGYGFAVWLLITFCGALVLWTCVALPVAWFVHESWLLRNRLPVILTHICICVGAVGYELHIWTFFERDGVDPMNFAIYAAFALAYAGVSAHLYLRYLARERVSSRTVDFKV